MNRPAREKKRRRRVLVVTTCSPRPMRVVQRARLCAITWTGQPGAVGGEAATCPARREMLQPHAVLEVADSVLNFDVAAMVDLESQGVPTDRGR